MKSVLILGGGVAGMSAAQELARRGFRVTLADRRTRMGGRLHEPSRVARGLPGAYRPGLLSSSWWHLLDTLQEIPCDKRSVLAHLVPASGLMFARRGEDEPLLFARPLRSTESLYDGLRALLPWSLGLEDEEVRAFAQALQVLERSCEARRQGEWERRGWWSFLRAEQRSAVFGQVLAEALPRALGAPDPTRASASAVGAALLHQLHAAPWEGTKAGPYAFDGPDEEVWWKPWQEHLVRLGVDLRLGTEVEALELRGGRICGAWLSDGARYLREADFVICALPLHAMPPLLPEALLQASPSLRGVPWLARHSVGQRAGLIFDLAREIPVAQGRVFYMDSPWRLSSVSAGQFWRRGLAQRGDGRVSGMLSVEILDGFGDEAGSLARLSPEGLREAVWAELKAHLNDQGVEILPEAPEGWSLDPSLRWSVEEGRYLHRSPHFVPLPGSWEKRPARQCGLPGLWLAARYVRHSSPLPHAESAAHVAREVVNEVLEAARWRGRRCALRASPTPRVARLAQGLDRARWRLGLPHQDA